MFLHAHSLSAFLCLLHWGLKPFLAPVVFECAKGICDLFWADSHKKPSAVVGNRHIYPVNVDVQSFDLVVLLDSTLDTPTNHLPVEAHQNPVKAIIHNAHLEDFNIHYKQQKYQSPQGNRLLHLWSGWPEAIFFAPPAFFLINFGKGGSVQTEWMYMSLPLKCGLVSIKYWSHSSTSSGSLSILSTASGRPSTLWYLLLKWCDEKLVYLAVVSCIFCIGGILPNFEYQRDPINKRILVIL